MLPPTVSLGGREGGEGELRCTRDGSGGAEVSWGRERFPAPPGLLPMAVGPSSPLLRLLRVHCYSPLPPCQHFRTASLGQRCKEGSAAPLEGGGGGPGIWGRGSGFEQICHPCKFAPLGLVGLGTNMPLLKPSQRVEEGAYENLRQEVFL